MKPIIFTQHARDAIRDRELDPAWVEATAREPEWTTPDPDRADVERRFRRIPEAEGRVLRVPVVETDHHIRVITVVFDRNERRRRR
jgi:hypothetical protein